MEPYPNLRNPASPASVASASEENPQEERVVDSARILEGRAEVVIRHNGRHYRLRCTRLGKLILTA